MLTGAAAHANAPQQKTQAHGDWVAGAHLSFPGIGHLRAADSGYVFVPANYSVPH